MKQKDKYEAKSDAGEDVQNVALHINSQQTQRASQNFILYKQCMQFAFQEKFPNKLKLLEEQGFIKLQKFNKFTSKIIKANQDSLLYEVTYGFYKTLISVFICDYQLDMIERKFIGQGNDGKVYSYRNQKSQEIVAKQFSLKDKDNNLNLQIFSLYLKQIFILKFASVLGVGPQFYKNYGYDLIVLSNYAEFLMEKCVVPESVGRLEFDKLNVNNSETELNMRRKLALCHEMHLVHSDIKIQNIGWSLKQNQCVFIDFGLARFVEEKVGRKTLTTFRGTYQYSSKQMQKIYLNKQPSLIDLFYNDLWALNKSMAVFNHKLSPNLATCSIQTQEISTTNAWASLQSFFKFHYFCFMQDTPHLQEIIFNEATLINCFQFLIYSFRQGQKKKKYLKHLRSLNINNNNQSHQKFMNSYSIDAIVYFKLKTVEKGENLESKWSITFENIKVIQAQKNFKFIWRRQNWMKKIFQLLFDDYGRDAPENLKQFREEIQKQILVIEGFAISDCFEKNWMAVLKIFQKYFIKNVRIIELQDINSIYKILFNFQEFNELSQQICELCLIDSNITNQAFLSYLRGYLSEYIFLNDTKLTWQIFLLKHKDIDKLKEIPYTCIEIIRQFEYLRQEQEFNEEISFENYFSLIKQLNKQMETALIKKQTREVIDILLILMTKNPKLKEKNIWERQTIASLQQSPKYKNYLPETLIEENLKNKLDFNYSHLIENFKIKQNSKNLKERDIQQIRSIIQDNPILSQVHSIWSTPLLIVQSKNQKLSEIMNLFLEQIAHRQIYESFNYLLQLSQTLVYSFQVAPCFQAFLNFYKGANVEQLQGKHWLQKIAILLKEIVNIFQIMSSIDANHKRKLALKQATDKLLVKIITKLQKSIQLKKLPQKNRIFVRTLFIFKELLQGTPCTLFEQPSILVESFSILFQNTGYLIYLGCSITIYMSNLSRIPFKQRQSINQLIWETFKVTKNKPVIHILWRYKDIRDLFQKKCISAKLYLKLLTHWVWLGDTHPYPQIALQSIRQFLEMIPSYYKSQFLDKAIKQDHFLNSSQNLAMTEISLAVLKSKQLKNFLSEVFLKKLIVLLFQSVMSSDISEFYKKQYGAQIYRQMRKIEQSKPENDNRCNRSKLSNLKRQAMKSGSEQLFKKYLIKKWQILKQKAKRKVCIQLINKKLKNSKKLFQAYTAQELELLNSKKIISSEQNKKDLGETQQKSQI